MLKKLLMTVAAVGVMSAPALATDYPETNLKVVGTWSSLPLYKNFEKPFWETTLPEKSGGKVKGEIQGFNEMGLKGAEIVRLMEQGVIDFGATVLGYLAADDPRNEAIDLAGLSPDVQTARRVSESYKPVLAELYDKEYDIKLLAVVPYSAQVLFCNRPIASLADLEGAKVRTANRTLAEFMEAVGATGVTMAFSEVVPSMQKGVIDCAITGSLSGYSAKWTEVSTHIYELPLGWSQVIMAVSNSKWNSLDDSVKTLITEQVDALADEIWRNAEYETAQGISCNTGGQCDFGEPAKLTFAPLTVEDELKLKVILKETVLPKWAERCGAECAAEWNENIGYIVDLEATATN